MNWFMLFVNLESEFSNFGISLNISSDQISVMSYQIQILQIQILRMTMLQAGNTSAF